MPPELGVLVGVVALLGALARLAKVSLELHSHWKSNCKRRIEPDER